MQLFKDLVSLLSVVLFAAVVQVWPLAQELSHAPGMDKTKQNTNKTGTHKTPRRKQAEPFWFPFYSRAYGIWKFLGQGLNWSCSCGLYHSNTRSEPHLWPVLQLCGNAGCLTHWARPGVKPTPSQRQCQILSLSHWSHKGNLGRTLFDISCNSVVFSLLPKAQEIKVKVNKWGLFKPKSFCTVKNYHWQHGEPTEWEKNIHRW